MVSIEIKDFKNIIETKQYTFTPGELCHLVGPSGAGKSTVLTAFEWCLYGKINGIKAKSQKNPIPEVIIQLQDGTIIRRESNDLIVTTPQKKELTLDAAQGYIFTKIGTKDLWKSMSYLEQGTRNILLIGSAEEKITLLRELVYGYGLSEDNDPDYYLNKTNSYLKRLTKEKDKIMIEYRSYLDEFEQYKEKYEESESRWSKSGYKYEKLEKIIEKTSSKIKKLTLDISSSKNIQREIESLRKKIESISFHEDISSKGIESLSNEIRLLEERRNLNERNKKIELYLPFQYDTLRYQDLLTNKRKYEDFIREINRHKLPKDKRSLQKLLKQCQDFEDYQEYSEAVKEAKKRDQLKEEIEEIEVEIEEKKEKIKQTPREKNTCLVEKESLVNQISKLQKKKYYSCPSCKEHLYLTHEGELKMGEKDMLDDLKKRLKEVEEELKIYKENEKLEKDIDECQKEIEDIESEIDLSLKNYSVPKKKLSKVENPFPGKNMDKMKEIVKRLFKSFIEDIDEDELEELSNGESLAKHLGSNFDDYIENPEKYETEESESYTIKEKELRKKLKDLKEKHEHNIRSTKEKQMLEDLIIDNKKKLRDISIEKDAEDTLEDFQGELKELHELKIDYIHYNEIKERTLKVKDYENRINDIEKDIEMTYSIYEKLKALSIEPLEELIDSINHKVNKYLDFLFEESTPIQVMLSLYKPTGGPKRDSKEKIVVNLKIYHGDRQYPNINLLSGGESDRVSLALTLALSSIGDSPFLFFDECMASLNCELRERCLGLIKEFSDDDKIIIDVCHESVEGYHDYIVKV